MGSAHIPSWNNGSFEWKETAPGKWARPLDSIEGFFHSATSTTPSGIAHIMVSVGATLPADLPYSIGDVATAWKSLRYDHPRIACTVDAGKLLYHVPNAEEAEAWTAQTLKIDHSGRPGRDVLATLRSCPTGVLIVLPSTREVIFQIPHWHIDGIGAIKFLGLIFDAVKRPRHDVHFGDEHRNLSDSLSKTLDLGRPRLQDIVRAQELSQEFMAGHPTISLGAKPSTGSEHAVKMERIQISADETAVVRRRAREHGFTVTHLCHSAMVQVVQYHAGKGLLKYASFFFISLREQVRAEPGRSDSPVAIRLTALPRSIDAGSGQAFWDLAQSLKKTYTLLDKNDQAALHRPMYDLLRKHSVARNGDGTAHLSSIGVVEKYISHRLDDFWIGVSSATPEVTVYIWTFQDCLHIAVWYNEAYHNKGDMRNFLQLMRQNLFDGLAIGQT